MTRNRQVVLARLPTDRLDSSHFDLVDGKIGVPETGQVLVRTILLFIDPANRAWMQAPTHRGQLQAWPCEGSVGILRVARITAARAHAPQILTDKHEEI
jgi:NADPH-dependent curcumin reductase CurA